MSLPLLFLKSRTDNTKKPRAGKLHSGFFRLRRDGPRRNRPIHL
ncbi:Hypothetical protein ACI5QL_00610 [Bacillus velezensis]|uniref:Uncharacterized protein n=1 Tax=Bacillus amyloliquefaciens (strain Y2) TaxID=1155777 RepID=I2C1X5_BACAY|nr:hypothetical protein MUS_0578 [Bacillus velezensis YAU B9601-Y2]RUS03188.1 hypothetical protein EFW58_03636 [Bacillus velezensis]